MAALSEAQVRQYREQGYLLVPGLIPEKIAEGAAAAMWRCMNADPDDRATWEQAAKFSGYNDPALLACYTPEFLATAAQLVGEPVEEFAAPTRALAINIFPQSGEWKWPAPHIDHAIKEHGHKTFPRAFRIATMTFLSDAPPHGGGTIVWPGSSAKLDTLARSAPEHYELMHTLNHELHKAELGEPVELTPRRGDVLFYHYLCAHSGSGNTSDHPRLALNMKW